MKKIENTEAMILNLQSTPLTPDEVWPQLFPIKKAAPKKIK